MDWFNERYVRVYCRDTPGWIVLPWEARALWLFLLRKMDRAGTLDLGRYGNRGIAAAVGMPLEVVEAMLPLLLEDGCLVHEGDRLRVPNYIAANETPSSGAERMRAYRERSRAKKSIGGDNTVTNRHPLLQNVTKSDALFKSDARGDSVPCRTVPYTSRDPSDHSSGVEEVRPEKPLDADGLVLADLLRGYLVAEKPNHLLAGPAWTSRRASWAKQMAPIARRRTRELAAEVLAWVFGDQGGSEFRFRVDSPKALADKFDKLELAMRRPNGARRAQSSQPQLQDWGRSAGAAAKDKP